MRHDHLFSQRNRTAERTVGMRVGQNLKKKGGKQYRGGLHKIGKLTPPTNYFNRP